MDPYDIGTAFEAIEDELIASMIRNMKHHRVEEVSQGIQWSQWQAEQLKALEKFKKQNQRLFSGKFKEINSMIEDAIKAARQQGNMDQEIAILEAIKGGFKGARKQSRGTYGEFFQLNDRKLNALIKATTDDFKNGETAMLRQANDQYRQIIYNAQVYANTGAGTYEKAVDMATKDFLSRGITCIEYANGARHAMKDYADMAIRTAAKRAYLTGEGEKRQEWGIHTVILNKRGDNHCPKCLPFVGKVLIDDVWSSGSSTDGPYPLMSHAIARGLYHPRCKDSHTTYFQGLSTADDTWTQKELDNIEWENRQEAKQQYAKRQEEKYDRLAKYSLDQENQKSYGAKSRQWKNVKFRTGDYTEREYVQYKSPLGDFRAVPQDNVVDVLREDSKTWIQNLTDKEKHAIKKYTYNSGDEKPNRFFERLNKMLRGDLPENEKLLEYADTISTALKKNKLKHDVIAYRGMSVDPSAGIQIGGLYRSKQFFSTSVAPRGALNGEYKIIIYVKKNSSCGYIENLSFFKKQRELLLDKDNIYRVLSRKDNVIELEVI